MNTTMEIEADRAARANQGLLDKALKRLEIAIETDPGLSLLAPQPAVIETLHREDLAAIEVFARACAAYGERPALGERAFTLDRGPGAGVVRYLAEFHTITYQAAWQRTVELATGLVRDGRTALRPGEIVGIYGFGSVDYVIADMACLYAGAASAVLQLGMAAEDLEHIVNEAAFATIVCGCDSLEAVLAVLPMCPTLRSVVVMDIRCEAAKDATRLAEARARTALPLVTVHELAAAGRAAAPLAPFIPPAGTDPLATLMYTSGSTGFPKGAMMTQRIWRSHWRLSWVDQFERFPSIGINFYPLSHGMGRNAVLRGIVLGGVTHFTLKSDLSSLFEDIRLVRPTYLGLVPRISEMIYQAYRTELQRRLKTGLSPSAARGQVFSAMRGAFLGDRLLAAFIGAAPTAPEIVEFLSDCFEIPVYEGYGSTEAGILSIDGRISRPPVTSYKLAGVPELGYRLSDKPFPRGELLVKTCQSIPGFFHNAAATQALYDPDGFLRTGDIVEERAPDHVHWVDRINNVVKLAQGEYVTLWHLESLFNGGSPLLEQVYLYANSQRAYLLGVVVPAWAAVHESLRLAGKEPTLAGIKQLLRLELNRIASDAELRSYEVPRDFLVEPERWTRENGLLTGVGKPARPQLKARYGERLEALYGQLDEAQQQEFRMLDEGGRTVAAQVQKAVEAVLGVPDLDIAAGSFKDFGGDSISALALATLLEEVCRVPVLVAAILNPGSPLQALVGMIEALQGAGAGALTFSSIHGKDASLIRAEDLSLDRLLSPADLDGAAALAGQPLPDAARTILVTGANGFLGHVLCLEWLEQMARIGGQVHCIIRGSSDETASARLRSAFSRGDPALEQRFTLLAAAGHLVVHAGDLAAPRLGLAEPVYEQLAAVVDLIVHPGALVNHVFSYEQLFAPNVLGTLELIRLALSRRRKRFDYVSTIGVLAGARTPGKVSEAAGVDALQSAWPVTGGYAHGYATSKWASEILLKQVHERFGTPVRVFRPGMILPHRRYLGQANAPDMLTRLLASVIYTGLAPRSFYLGGQGAKAHYDGLPVDFIAAAMVALSSAAQADSATYQVSNANWEDGISLDTLIDWVQTAGYGVERVDDHAAWYQAFSARLQALPAAQRQHSSLPILNQWAKPIDSREGERVDASRFCQQVRQSMPAGETGVPHLSEAFLHKYLADLRALDILKS